VKTLLVKFLLWLVCLVDPTIQVDYGDDDDDEPDPPPPARILLWDPKLTQLGIGYVPRDAAKYYLAAAWMTSNGSWENVPDWARQWQRDTLGGDHHCFGRIETADGHVIAGLRFLLTWPDGGDERGAEADGWANIPIAGQNWNPANGAGPYTWFVESGDKLAGLGLPLNNHVSFFGVWRPK